MKMIAQLCLGLLLTGLASCQEIRTVKTTVTEEDGTPIEGIDVTVNFLAYGTDKTIRNKGVTNKKGVCQVSGSTSGRIHVRMEKEGYYQTKSGRLSRHKDHDMTFVLRKIKNPIPLYAKKFRGKAPGIGRRYGFDFEEGDWVEPQGKGKRTDLYFRVDLTKDTKGKRAGKLSITFPNEEEGVAIIAETNGYLILSKLVMPHYASENNYQNKIERTESGYQNERKPRNTAYFLRTRAKQGKPGDTIFNYAKFQNGINFSMGGGMFLEEPYRSRYPDEYGAIEFTYYFNSTPNDRNLEFDTNRNLFRNLDSTERVNEP